MLKNNPEVLNAIGFAEQILTLHFLYLLYQ